MSGAPESLWLQAITSLLAVIAGLLAICGWFLHRMVTQNDTMVKQNEAVRKDLHTLRNAFMLFRQRVSIMLNLEVDDPNKNDDLKLDTTPT